MEGVRRGGGAGGGGVGVWGGGGGVRGGEGEAHRFWGVFPSLAAAKAHVPDRFNRGFDAPNLSENFDETIPERDLYVVRILSGLMPEVKTLFDLGGNIGLCFYRYRSRIPYPKAL